MCLNGSPCYILSFKGNKLNKDLSKSFDSRRLVGLTIRIISAIESFFLSFIVFKILAENIIKTRFSSFKGNNSYKESSDNFDPFETFVGLIIRII